LRRSSGRKSSHGQGGWRGRRFSTGARDPQALSAWYAKHLGIQPAEGSSLLFAEPESNGMTVLAHFPLDTSSFGEGAQQAMVNFRVDELDQMLRQLAEAGVRIDPKREDQDYGRFRWIWDLEGNRVAVVGAG
jgi:predicted enzyme related to lactoylglutathione lyase